MAKDADGNEVPVIQAPAMVLSALPKTEHEQVQSVIKQDARIDAAKIIVEGQQKTSNKWENTQLFIAIVFSVTTCIVLGARGLGVTDAEFPEVLGVLTGMIVQAYFLRTNSHKVGGVAEGKPATER